MYKSKSTTIRIAVEYCYCFKFLSRSNLCEHPYILTRLRLSVCSLVSYGATAVAFNAVHQDASDVWLQALFISEDRAGKVVPSSAKLTSFSLPAADASSLQSKDDSKLQAAPSPRRNFKLFNKGFRIFN